jgi:hypothetical protein
MTKIKVTPFLIINPIVAVWALFLLVRIMNRDGMAVIMSGLFVTIIFTSIILLLLDRLIVERIALWKIFVGEILLILVSIKFIHWYL